MSEFEAERQEGEVPCREVLDALKMASLGRAARQSGTSPVSPVLLLTESWRRLRKLQREGGMDDVSRLVLMSAMVRFSGTVATETLGSGNSMGPEILLDATSATLSSEKLGT